MFLIVAWREKNKLPNTKAIIVFVFMIIKAIKTRKFLPPKDDLFSLIKESFPSKEGLKEKSIIVFTSKIVAIWQGRCVKVDSGTNKDDLIKKEADFYLDRNQIPDGYAILTIKDDILIPSAGVDESNANNYYILWPRDPYLAAKKIHKFIKKEYKLKKFGVIITDSHCTPLRTGIMGIGIAYYGFYPLKDYRGKKDIFGRKMKISRTNIVDSLAAAAVFKMGEGKEQTPIAIIEKVGFLRFGNFPFRFNPLKIKKDKDIYYPLIKSVKWNFGGNFFIKAFPKRKEK